MTVKFNSRQDYDLRKFSRVVRELVTHLKENNYRTKGFGSTNNPVFTGFFPHGEAISHFVLEFDKLSPEGLSEVNGLISAFGIISLASRDFQVFEEERTRILIDCSQKG